MIQGESLYSGSIRVAYLSLNWLIWALSKHCDILEYDLFAWTINKKWLFLLLALPWAGVGQSNPFPTLMIPAMANPLPLNFKTGFPFPTPSGAPIAWSLSQESSAFDFTVLLISNFTGQNQRFYLECPCIWRGLGVSEGLLLQRLCL